MGVAQFAMPIFRCQRRNRVRVSSACRLSHFRSSLLRSTPSFEIEVVVRVHHVYKEIWICEYLRAHDRRVQLRMRAIAQVLKFLLNFANDSKFAKFAKLKTREI